MVISVQKKSATDLLKAKEIRESKKSKALSTEEHYPKDKNNIVYQYDKLSIDFIRSLREKDDLREVVDLLCESFGGVTPLSLQAGVVNGVDIRRTSVIFSVYQEIRNEMEYTGE